MSLEVFEDYFNELEREGFDFTVTERDKIYMGDRQEKDKKAEDEKIKAHRAAIMNAYMEDEYKYIDEGEISTPDISDSDDDLTPDPDPMAKSCVQLEPTGICNLQPLPPLSQSQQQQQSQPQQQQSQQQQQSAEIEKLFNHSLETRDVEADKVLAENPELQQQYIEKLISVSLACAGLPLKQILSHTYPNMDLSLLPDELGGALELGIKDDANRIIYIYTFMLAAMEPTYKLAVPQNLVKAKQQVTQNIIPSLLKRAIFLYDYVRREFNIDELLCPMQNNNDCPILILASSDISKHSTTPYMDVKIGIGISIRETVKSYDELEQESTNT